MKCKKGQINFLLTGIIAFITIAILAGVGIMVNEESIDAVGSTICVSEGGNYSIYNSTHNFCQNASGANYNITEFTDLENPNTAIGNFTTFLPIIALVLVAVVVLGYVYLLRRGG